ncbi:MAG TPA: serine/threonine-protein kinase [Solirubrobacteraceae bacterium]|nr:serine/threonine-protein kinase [Solirubrobacteraceae bacterium]
MGATTQIALPDRYRVLHHVARGGMASVWAAEDRMLERRVAVKVLASHLAGDAGARERFQREARAAARVSDHPHVVTIFDVGEHEGNAFIVMEHMTGGSLADQLRGGEVIEHDCTVRWLTEAAAALDAAHGEGIVHRDVKPANLLLDARNRLAVADFGIARLAADSAMTQTGMVMGTAAYLSPEQAEGAPATEASDRYALAVVAYELLTGERPFRAEHAAAQARQHMQAERPRASRAAPQLPGELDDVLIEGLAIEPDRRPPTAGALAERIRRALHAPATAPAPAPTAPTPAYGAPRRVAAPAATHREPRPQRAPAAPPSASSRPQREPGPAGPPSPRRRRWVGVVVAAALALLVGLAAVLALGGGDGQPDSRQADEPPSAASSQPDPEPEETTPAPESDSAPEQPEPAPQPEDPAAADADPVSLNDEGYALFQDGSYAEAVPPLRRSVAAFEAQDRTGEMAYAFALYNLGASLNRSGSPSEAVPFLERRLEVSDFKTGTVRQELREARAAGGG